MIMFIPKRTAFILGAGASWHYGYPTGERLVKNIIKKAGVTSKIITTCVLNSNMLGNRPPSPPKYATQYFDTRFGNLDALRRCWQRARQDCDDLSERLTTVDPLVIDYFLDQNPQLSEIGKLMIAWVLLECESIYLMKKINANRLDEYHSNELNDAAHDKPVHFDNWYRFVVHKLVTGCSTGDDLLLNQVSFVTFNYDVSLEYELYHSLKALEQFSKGDLIDKFLSEDRIIHVYGRIRQDFRSGPPQKTRELFANPIKVPTKLTMHALMNFCKELNTMLDLAFEASQTIKTIAPNERHVSTEISKAKEAIMNANCVYILGYGFDENNNKLLNLNSSLNIDNNQGKTILFTNLNDHNQVNKKASRLINGSSRTMLAGSPEITSNGTSICEKSRRNVYDALAVDFDAPEED
jgi:hypothetical protein